MLGNLWQIRVERRIAEGCATRRVYQSYRALCHSAHEAWQAFARVSIAGQRINGVVGYKAQYHIYPFKA